MKKISIAAGTLITLLMAVATGFAQTRDDLLKQIEAKRAELAALQKLIIEPSEEDRTAYADFLKQPETGLMRILPRETYGYDVVGMRGGGSYYSFTKRTHEYSNTTDISLEQGYFQAGFAGANYGMLTTLGDVPLENVSLETAAAQILASHTPATEEPQARIEQRRTSEGAVINGASFRNRLLLKVNSTYLVRTINYSGSDALVAFRVARVDNDNSAVIVWKLLKKYPIPYLARN